MRATTGTQMKNDLLLLPWRASECLPTNPMHQILQLALLLFIGCSTAAAFAQQGKTRAAAKAQAYPPLPDNVERKQVVIWSDGVRMAGDVYRPKNLQPADKLPAIVFVHGTGGVKKMVWSIKLATAFAQNGYLFLNFDYRGWGESDSRLSLMEAMPEPDESGLVTVQARAIRAGSQPGAVGLPENP